jgi:hypothetical protein
MAGGAVAIIAGTAMLNLTTADAAQSSCSGTRTRSQSLSGYGTLELYRVSGGSSSTTYCVKLTRSPAAPAGSTSQIVSDSDGYGSNGHVIVPRTSQNPVAGNVTVGNDPVRLRGTIFFPQDSRSPVTGYVLVP